MTTEPIDIHSLIAAGPDLIASLDHVQDFALIGSALYMPHEKCNDVNWLVLLREDAGTCADVLEGDGWVTAGEYDADGEPVDSVVSVIVRNGKGVSLTLTEDRGYFERYVTAMEVCKALRLAEKADRIKVCKIVRDGMTADEVAS